MSSVTFGMIEETVRGFLNASRNSSSLHKFTDSMYNANPLPLEGKTFLVTGATHGLGQGMASHLLAWGARLVLPCRKMYPDLVDELFAAALKLREKFGKDGSPEVEKDGGKVDVYVMDLSDLHSVEHCVESIRKNYEHIDVVINNAGLINHSANMSVQGIELSFAVNFLGTAYFTQLLVGSGLLEPKDGILSRIVSVSSEGHRGSMPFNKEEKFGYHSSRGVVDTLALYDYSKLCQVTWFLELARRQEGKQVVHDVCPGPVASNIAGNVSYVGKIIGVVLGGVFPSAQNAAIPLLRLAVAPEYNDNSGHHYHMAEQKDAREDALDPANGEWIWEQTNELIESLLQGGE